MAQNEINHSFVSLVKMGVPAKFKHYVVRAMDSCTGQWKNAQMVEILSPYTVVIHWKCNIARLTTSVLTIKNSPCCRENPLNWPIQPIEIPESQLPRQSTSRAEKPTRNLLAAEATLEYARSGRARPDLVIKYFFT